MSARKKSKLSKNVRDKPEIEDCSSDSDDILKDFNTSVPKLNQTITRKTPRPTVSAKKVLQTKPIGNFSSITHETRTILSSSDSDEDLIEVKKFNNTCPRLQQLSTKATTSTSGPKSHSSSFKTKILNLSLLGKRKLFDPEPGPSKPTIEDFSSDEDLFRISPEKNPPPPPPEKESNLQSLIEEIDEANFPCDDDETTNSPKISQVSSEASSQMHRFNVKPPPGVKIKSGGYVEQLLKALSDAQQENLQWNYQDPGSGAKYFTVSHFETVLGSVMIFFMHDNKKCAIYLEPSHKMVPKLKVGATFVFRADFEPYEIDNDVRVYAGVTKLKFVH